MTLSRRVFLAAPLVLAACQTEKAAVATKPTFYEDLASPTAQVDQQRALSMINQYRLRNGSGPLSLDPELGRIARAYAREMAAADRMSHSLSDEARLGNRLKANGYAFEAAGENIAAGYRTLAEAFSGWRESPAHDRGMKDRDMTHMGIGTAFNPNSKYKVFWCLIFSRPRGVAVGTPGVAASPSLVTVAGARVGG
ncbi:CAP domain-containing protein [Chthonobacter rhizosphaerae]|uniref:CAP domain-containing protein n=1 Tax=Chthonobacter rhizosphaerae TaxID=2735553 RepID=UPI0015EF2FBE|nr:CAP domain-containing protein [Chthonobacter rhizosphaerae]